MLLFSSLFSNNFTFRGLDNIRIPLRNEMESSIESSVTGSLIQVYWIEVVLLSQFWNFNLLKGPSRDLDSTKKHGQYPSFDLSKWTSCTGILAPVSVLLQSSSLTFSLVSIYHNIQMLYMLIQREGSHFSNCWLDFTFLLNLNVGTIIMRMYISKYWILWSRIFHAGYY